MCQIIQDPQLRYTPDETAVAEMLVQFAATKAEDPPHTLKVVGWGNLGVDISQTYHQGDRVIIQGSLRMNSFDRPEGFKEKRAELTVSRIHSIGGEPVARQPLSQTTPSATPSAIPAPAYQSASAPSSVQPSRESFTPPTVATPSVSQPVVQPLEEDEIPF